MKHLRIIWITALAVGALFGAVGADSAAAETVLCTENASPCPAKKVDGNGTEIKMRLVSGTKSKLTTNFISIECSKSSINSKVTSAGKAIGASVEVLSFEECGKCEVTVLAKGTLELERIASTTNATVKSTGTEITTACSTIFGTVHCIYQTNVTDFGTLEGGNPAKIKVSELDIPRLSTNALCDAEAKWSAEYEVTTPKPLYVEPEAKGGAAETVLCTEAASRCPVAKTDGIGSEIKASLVSGTKSKLTTPYNNIECSKSSINSKVTSTGKTLGASVESLTFEECNCEVKVLAKGTLELERLVGTENATVKSTGTEITTVCSTIFGNVHCIYKTEATDLGTLEKGNPAKLRMSGATVPVLATDTRCKEGTETAKWDAEYEVTSPKPLYVEPEEEIPPAKTVLCTESSNPCPEGKADGNGTEIKASLVSGTKSRLTTSYKNIECGKSSITAKVTSTGKTIGSIVEGLTFEECNCEVKVLTKGTVELAAIYSSTNATVRSTGTEITTNCSTELGTIHCIYKTNVTDVGTLEGGNPARLEIFGADIPRLTTNASCAEKGNWHAEYEVTSPKPLYVEPE